MQLFLRKGRKSRGRGTRGIMSVRNEQGRIALNDRDLRNCTVY